MADTNQNPVHENASQAQQNSVQKTPFFWGNEAVFENLEKFERISNLMEGDQVFDFNFDDSLPEEEQKSDSAPWFDFEADALLPDVELSPLEGAGSQETLSATEPSTFEAQVWAVGPDIEFSDVSHLSSERTEEISEVPLDDKEHWDEELSVTSQKASSPESSFEAVEEPSVQEFIASSEGQPLTVDEEESPIADAQAHINMEKEPETGITDLIQKYEELLTLGKAILKLLKKIQKTDQETFELIGNDTDKATITYLFHPYFEGEIPCLEITKLEHDLTRAEEHEHRLLFSSLTPRKNLLVTIDGVQLYEEEKDLQEPMKAMQVSDKLNKFIFLCTEKQTELEEQWAILKEEREKMRAFRDIFRNF